MTSTFSLLAAGLAEIEADRAGRFAEQADHVREFQVLDEEEHVGVGRVDLVLGRGQSGRGGERERGESERGESAHEGPQVPRGLS